MNVGADWSHHSHNSFGKANFSMPSQDPYSLFRENLTNEVYMVRSVSLLDTAFGQGIALFGPPRTYGVKLGYQF